MRVSASSRSAIALLAAACVSLAAVALAESPGSGDRAAAQTLIDTLTKDHPRATLAREPLARARRALERAAEARAAADHRHAARLEAVAREWAETARDLARAADAEQQAHKLEQRAHELESKLIRARALVEETVARHGRAQQMLQQLGQPAPVPSTRVKK